jgi:hypothetical protein
MAVLDFKEIPKANIASGNQDRFEQFARDVLSYLGYKIISDPDRGADGGKDLIVEEKRVGVGGETLVKWLVSCKHKAHSRQSVTPRDEANIRDRIDDNQCKAFIGFYSTLASSGLGRTFEAMRPKYEVQVFDNEKIEKNLLSSSQGLQIAERYFPKSCSDWKVENPTPAKVFSQEPELRCEYCGKDLLKPKSHGIIVFWDKRREDYENEKEQIEDIYWCCKGHCDSVLSVSRRERQLEDSWEDIPDVMIPVVFARWIFTPMNRIYSGTKYSEQAFAKLKEFISNIYPFVAREATSSEKERVKSLMQIPAFLGGLGY